jgi:hypothetical protein
MRVITTAIGAILVKMNYLNKSKKDFLSYCFCLFLSLQGRLNFLQMARYSDEYTESSCRNHFKEYFDFSTFNTELILAQGSGEYIIALDMSYIRKSGKSTQGVGKYWSGCSSRTEWGLEAGILAVVDVVNHTAFSLDAVQTPDKEQREALGISYLDYCVSVVLWNKTNITRLSKYLAVDAYFTKKEFIIPVIEKTGLHIIGRLRDDANLRYLYQGERRTGRGRPTVFGNKLDWENIDLSLWTKVQEDTKQIIYEAKLQCEFLKRTIKVSYVIYKGKTGKQHTKKYFSTDTDLSAIIIQKYYQLRFQEEFLIRDAKQFTGLEHCQARDINKTEFHWNAALTAVNLAKITHWLTIPKDKRESFSMKNVKVLYNNKLIIDRIFSILPNGDKLKKNNPKIAQLYLIGLRE